MVDIFYLLNAIECFIENKKFKIFFIEEMQLQKIVYNWKNKRIEWKRGRTGVVISNSTRGVGIVLDIRRNSNFYLNVLLQKSSSKYFFS